MWLIHRVRTLGFGCGGFHKAASFFLGKIYRRSTLEGRGKVMFNDPRKRCWGVSDSTPTLPDLPVTGY